ncbi:PREDICTED: phospholipase A2-alpha-like [Ipomoea nil]|uniref:phospholipase A2-alpha-like n=1 Tax=Ipomoea nil TaxID=35883 RepID=UPI00090092DF|nr:PREDICTED: phospholipase A2-alpha-like [Ipomoea nil]
MAALLPFKFALLFLFAFISLNSYVIPTRALNVGVDAGAGLSLAKECSRTCESKFCGVPPFLRYGKYCGILYTGCPGEKPCDGLDACCMQHDVCIQNNGNDYLSQHCNKNFLACVTKFKKSKAKTFKGNTCKVDEVVNIITDVMDAAIIAGRIFKKP